MDTRERLLRIISDCDFLAKELMDAGHHPLAAKVVEVASFFHEEPRRYRAGTGQAIIEVLDGEQVTDP